MPFHIHPRPAESHALHAQAEFLFRAIFSAQLDRTARADHAMPGQSRNLAQNTHHLARRSRPAGSLSHSPIARNRSRRQAANAAHDASAFKFHPAFTRLRLSPVHS